MDFFQKGRFSFHGVDPNMSREDVLIRRQGPRMHVMDSDHSWQSQQIVRYGGKVNALWRPLHQDRKGIPDNAPGSSEQDSAKRHAEDRIDREKSREVDNNSRDYDQDTADEGLHD